MPTLEETQVAYQWLANHLARSESQRLLILFGLIAEREPQMLREVLRKVFDLTDIERGEKHLRGYLNELRTQLNVASSRCAALERRLEKLEQRNGQSVEQT